MSERYWYLTPRQWQVLDMVAQGMLAKEIAGELGCSVQSVKNHLTLIYARLDVSGAIPALRKAGYIVDRSPLRLLVDETLRDIAKVEEDLDAIERRVQVQRDRIEEVRRAG